MGKTEIDGDAAPFFFRKPVRVDARQRLYQGRFAMVDVARRAHDYVSHRVEFIVVLIEGAPGWRAGIG
jgi:hypothetical protein